MPKVSLTAVAGFVAIILAATACSTGIQATATFAPTPTATPTPDTSLTSLLDVQIGAQSSVQQGEAITVRLLVRNKTDMPLTFFHGVRPTAFTAIDARGQEVWDGLHPRFCFDFMPLTTTTFQPGETKEYSTVWEQTDGRNAPCPVPKPFD